ncbi:hypothetical protein ACFPRL_21250 [Pseudoclavibacter helvolus]
MWMRLAHAFRWLEFADGETARRRGARQVGAACGAANSDRKSEPDASRTDSCGCIWLILALAEHCHCRCQWQ